MLGDAHVNFGEKLNQEALLGLHFIPSFVVDCFEFLKHSYSYNF